MNPHELTTKLAELKRNDRAGLDALAKQVGDEGRSLVRELVESWSAARGDMAYKAAYILARLGDLSMAPLLEATRVRDPLPQAWRMERLVEGQLQLRNGTVALLNRFLGDKTPIPYAQVHGAAEDVAAERRVCDEAYQQIRRLLNFDESPAEGLLNGSLFLKLSFQERDLEIEKWRASRTWTNLLQDSSAFKEPGA